MMFWARLNILGFWLSTTNSYDQWRLKALIFPLALSHADE